MSFWTPLPAPQVMNLGLENFITPGCVHIYERFAGNEISQCLLHYWRPARGGEKFHYSLPAPAKVGAAAAAERWAQPGSRAAGLNLVPGLVLQQVMSNEFLDPPPSPPGNELRT